MRLVLSVLLICHAPVFAGIACDAVDKRLNDMAAADQKIRNESQALENNAGRTPAQQDELHQRWTQIDSANTAELKEIIAACGWPAGQKASHNAWLLAQHADKDPAFQRSVKELLEAAVKNGTAAPRDLAYLADRIAVAEGRPQEYGTQFTMPDRCTLTLLPVDSREQVNRRRQAVGLPSLEEYEAEGRKRAIPADCSGKKNHDLISQAERLAYPFQVEVTIQLADRAKVEDLKALAAKEGLVIAEFTETSTYAPVRGDGREFPKVDAVPPAGPPVSQTWTFKLAPIDVASREQLEAALARLARLDAYKANATVGFKKATVTTH
jgi:hypothetical protein